MYRSICMYTYTYIYIYIICVCFADVHIQIHKDMRRTPIGMYLHNPNHKRLQHSRGLKPFGFSSGPGAPPVSLFWRWAQPRVNA